MNLCRRACATALAASLLAAAPAWAGGGLFGLDHYVNADDQGIWARRNQLLLIGTMLAGESAVALWEGGDTRLGRTMWKSIDATVVSGVAAEGLKLAFTRARPSETTDPNQWFQGGGHASFPSGEVTVVSAIITPVVLEYRHDHPAVYALELLPLYDAIARVKVHGHWQSDVLAGYALGTAAGILMSERTRTPVILSLMPHSVYVGLRHSF
ncbi:MAG: phosphatase PAP2 family protein [Gammaproteobacteria bacterium]|nr:phosphatase PAP2 family protein [Gammaproteobacteria bacterium]MDE2249785.1 phosphatase PAP2 family protein [Gammaproteobacteria bacterium]